jgi:ferredoxin
MFGDSSRLDILYFNPTFVPDNKRADSCVFCGKCNKKCPQNIDIPRELQKIHDIAISLTIGVDIEKLRDDDNIVLFGSGADGRNTLSALRKVGVNVCGFCDNNSKVWGSYIDGVEVLNPQELRELNATVIITSNKYYEAIKEQLADMGIKAVNT